MTKYNVKNEKFAEEHGVRIGDIAVYGPESNSTTRRLAMMNLAIRDIEGDLGSEHPDTFRRDLQKSSRAIMWWPICRSTIRTAVANLTGLRANPKIWTSLIYALSVFG